MAKLERVTNKIFGNSAGTTGDNPEIGQFGSAITGEYVGTGDVATIQSLEAWNKGWIGAVTPGEDFPTLPEMTAVHKVLSYQTGYILQEGIAEYDTNTTYFKGSIVKVYGTELKLYVSITDNNQGNAVTDNNYWNEIPLTGIYHPPLFSFQWCDHQINDVQWLRGDTFSWQSGSVYVRAYNTLLSEYNNSASETETEGNITFKRTPNGYKITTAEYENAVYNKFLNDGVAWYYVLDTTNTQFKLPRTQYGFEGLRTNPGDFISEKLPNINATATNVQFLTESYGTGAIEVGGVKARGNYAAGSGNAACEVVFNASNSSSTYQDNAPVQERATQMYLYFYIGEYSQTAIEQTAGLSTELFNNKVDLNGNNAAFAHIIDTYKSGTSGYIIWSNGYCKQWGYSPCATTVELVKKFNDSNYSINGQFFNTTVTTYYNLTLYSKSESNFAMNINGGSSSFYYYWVASGYLAEGEY